MSAPTDGGPAFPGRCQSEQHVNINEGLSLRDWFAGQSLKAHRQAYRDKESAVMAEWAYQDADAMLAARAGGTT